MDDNGSIAEALHLPNLAGELPTAWTWKRLDKACFDVIDCPHSTPKIAPLGPLMVRSQDIRSGVFLVDQAARVSEETYQDRIKRAEPTYGDLVYSREGTYFGIAAEIPKGTRVCLGQRMVLLRPDPKQIQFRFLKYWLNSPVLQSHIHGHRDGTVAERLNLPTIRALPVPVAPIHAQERIADILGSLDDKIELNRRMNETLEAMARRLFKSWFIDFDPVHAKAALRREHPKLSNADLSRRALPNMAPEIAELFPDSFEDSTLGQIPKGWKVSRVDEVSEINGWTLGKNDELETIDYIEISQVMCGDVGDIERYQRGEEPSRARRRLRHGDVVLSTVRPDRGAYFVAIDPPATLIASTGFAVFTSTIVPWSWTSCALTSPEVFEYLGHHADGGAYPAINPALIGKIEYAIPSCVDVLNAFHLIAEDWYRLAEDHRRESMQLRKTRDKLLPCLLSGEFQTLPAGALT